MSKNQLSATEQPEPTTNTLPAIWDLVIQDITNRDQMGLEKYKTRLQPFNGRDSLIDVYQEALDEIVYLRQLIFERDQANEKLKEAFQIADDIYVETATIGDDYGLPGVADKAQKIKRLIGSAQLDLKLKSSSVIGN